MAMKTNKGKDALFTEINITPLTDIFLVLLIIMMVVAPTFQSGDSSITMPEINSGISVEQRNATIAITKEGEFYLNGTQIVSDSLIKELETLAPTLEKKEVVVKADKDTKSKEIMSVMNAAQSAGYEKLIVAGEPLSKKEQKQLREESEQKNSTMTGDAANDGTFTPENRPRVNIPIEG
ncbi:biopolymer transporter ExbD [bacterium]|nr:biopolymer transporter ExbD [bacterium]